MIRIPEHFAKVVKEYAAGRVKPENVEVTPDPNADITKDVYEFSLPSFTHLGEPAGTYVFAVTLESLVSTKLNLQAEMDAAIAAFDKFMTNYAAFISVLEDVKAKKKDLTFAK